MSKQRWAVGLLTAGSHRVHSRCRGPTPCDSQSVPQAGRHDGAEMGTETQECCCLPRSRSLLAELGVDPDAQTPSSAFLSSLHTEPPSHQPLRKNPLFVT